MFISDILCVRPVINLFLHFINLFSQQHDWSGMEHVAPKPTSLRHMFLLCKQTKYVVWYVGQINIKA